LYAAQNYEMGLGYERARVGSDRLFVTSPHWIDHIDRSVSRLKMSLHAPGPSQAFTTINQVDAPPIAVRLNGKPLPEADPEDEIGWQYIPERALVLVRGEYHEGGNFMEVKFRHPVRSPQEQRLEVPYIPKKLPRVRRP